jgi:hypothetical protein
VSASSAQISGSASVHIQGVSISASAPFDMHLSSSIALASSVPASMSINAPSASLSSDLHVPTPVVHVNGTASNSSSEVHTPVPVVPFNGSSTALFPTGQSSILIHPSGTGASYPAGSSPTGSTHHYGNSSAPVSYFVPAYRGSASAVVYGGNAAQSTPCTTSSAYGAAYTPVYPNSVNNYGGNPSYPVSSPVKNDYPYLPEFTPLSAVYPPTTSAPAYNDYNQPPVSKTTITTTYTTTYVDVCETGYTTKTTTFAVTYCSTSTPTVPTLGKPNNPPTYGWDITTKVCNSGCGQGPKTVTVTVPCTQCNYASQPTPTPNKPSCNGPDCALTTTTKVYQTKIITLTKVPVPEGPKSVYDLPKSAPVYGDKPASKPVDAPKATPEAGKPVVSGKPVPSPGKPGNGTVSMSFGTGVGATPTKTGYGPPVFTGAAASVQVGGVVAVLGAVAALVL